MTTARILNVATGLIVCASWWPIGHARAGGALTNPGFEQGAGNRVPGWRVTGRVQIMRDGPQAGKQAVELVADAAIEQRVARLGAGVYELTLWARGRGRMRVHAGPMSRDLPLGQTWHVYSVIFQQSDDGHVTFVVTCARDGLAAIDTVQLAPADDKLRLAWDKQQEALVQFGYIPGHLNVQRPPPKVQTAPVKPEPVPDEMRQRVVFCDDRYDGSWVEAPVKVARWFARRGFRPMDAEAIGQWLGEKIRAGAYGTVAVFAYGLLPSSVVGPKAFGAVQKGWGARTFYRDAPIRRYMEAGGRVAWLGGLTLYAVQGPTGPMRPFPGRGADLLADLKIDQRIYYGARSGGPLVLTKAARQWGLSRTYAPVRPVNLPDVTVSFVTVPKDWASQVFLKTLNPRYPLSGLVSLPVYVHDPPREGVLEDTYRLAMYLGKPVPVPSATAETVKRAPVELSVRLGARGDRTAFVRGEKIVVHVDADNRTAPFEGELSLMLMDRGAELRKTNLKRGVATGTAPLTEWELTTADVAVGDYTLQATLTEKGKTRATTQVSLAVRRLSTNPFFLAVWSSPPPNRYRRKAFLEDVRKTGWELIARSTHADDFVRFGLRFTTRIEGPEGFPTAVNPEQMPDVARRKADGSFIPNPWTPAQMRTGLSHPRVIVGRSHGTAHQLREMQGSPALMPYALTNDDFSAFYGHDWSAYTTGLFKAMTGLDAPKPTYDKHRMINVPRGVVSESQPWLAWCLFHARDVSGRYAKALREAKERAFPGSRLGEVPGHMQIPLWYEGLYPFYQHGRAAMDLASYYYYDAYWVPLVGNVYWDDVSRLGRREGPVWTTPDCYAGGDEPSYYRNTFFLHLAGGVSGLNYFAYRPALPQAKKEIGRLIERVIEPLGPTLCKLQPARKSVGLFLPFATQACDWIYPTLAVYPYANLLCAQIDVEPVCREELMAGRAFQYDTVLLWNADWVSAGAARALDRYMKRGGVVVLDAASAVRLPGAKRLEIDLAMGADALSQSDPTEARFGRPGIRDYHHPRRVAAVRGALAPYANPTYEADTSAVIVRPFAACGVTYLWLVNVHTREEYEYLRARLGAGVRVPDKQKALGEARAFLRKRGAYGRTVSTRLTMPAGDVVVYDLLSRRELATSPAGPKRLACQVSMERLGGTLLALYPAKVGRLTLDVHPGSPGHAREHILECRIRDTRARLLAGVCPVRVEVLLPNGTPAPYDRYDAVENGRWIFTVTPAMNEPRGRWTVRVTELASGRQVTAPLRVR